MRIFGKLSKTVEITSFCSNAKTVCRNVAILHGSYKDGSCTAHGSNTYSSSTGILNSPLSRLYRPDRNLLNGILCCHYGSTKKPTPDGVIENFDVHDAKGANKEGTSEAPNVIPIGFVNGNPTKLLVIPFEMMGDEKQMEQHLMRSFKLVRKYAQQMDTFMKLVEPQKKHTEKKSEQNEEFEASLIKSEKISTELPNDLEEKLRKMAISSMELGFEMDMTNIKNALMLDGARQKGIKPDDSSLNAKERMLALETKLELDPPLGKRTIPLNFNALIQGKVEVDPTRFSSAEMAEIEMPEFHENLTTVAASICQTALKKGFEYQHSNRSNEGDSGKQKNEMKTVAKNENPFLLKSDKKKETRTEYPAEESEEIYEQTAISAIARPAKKSNFETGQMLRNETYFRQSKSYEDALNEAAKRRDALQQRATMATAAPQTKTAPSVPRKVDAIVMKKKGNPCKKKKKKPNPCKKKKKKKNPCKPKKKKKPNPCKPKKKKKANPCKPKKKKPNPCKPKKKKKPNPCKPKKKKPNPCKPKKKPDPCKPKKKKPDPCKPKKKPNPCKPKKKKKPNPCKKKPKKKPKKPPCKKKAPKKKAPKKKAPKKKAPKKKAPKKKAPKKAPAKKKAPKKKPDPCKPKKLKRPKNKPNPCKPKKKKPKPCKPKKKPDPCKPKEKKKPDPCKPKKKKPNPCKPKKKKKPNPCKPKKKKNPCKPKKKNPCQKPKPKKKNPCKPKKKCMASNQRSYYTLTGLAPQINEPSRLPLMRRLSQYLTAKQYYNKRHNDSQQFVVMPAEVAYENIATATASAALNKAVISLPIMRRFTTYQPKKNFSSGGDKGSKCKKNRATRPKKRIDIKARKKLQKGDCFKKPGQDNVCPPKNSRCKKATESSCAGNKARKPKKLKHKCKKTRRPKRK